MTEIVRLYKKLCIFIADTPQTSYITLIEDSSDELIPGTFYPQKGASGIPTVVEFNLYYYQESKDIKRLSKVEINLLNYTDLNLTETGYY